MSLNQEADAAMKSNIDRHQVIAWLAIAVLLFLRIPFTIFITMIFPIDTQWGPAVFQVGTYFLTAFLVWWERERLPEFHVDTLALAIIILFKPVQTLTLKYWNIDTPITFPHLPGLMIWAIAAGLILVLWLGGYRPSRIRKSELGWLALGLLAGLTMSSLFNIGSFSVDIHQVNHDYVQLSSAFTSIGMAFLYQLGFAAVSEEPLFRGFLWGYLFKLAWKEKWIWLFQAVVFLIAHLYFAFSVPYNFWIVVPIAGLVFGLFAWRSRSLAPGMLAHAAYNASTYVVVFRLINLFTRSF
jgi:membrane protease YdiL (CAAX protease family)